MKFIEKIKEQARTEKKKIVLPETMDERILDATKIIVEEDIAEVILLGNKESILKTHPTLTNVEIINPLTSELTKEFAQKLYELRKEKEAEAEVVEK